MKVCRKYIVTGLVQGVYFRKSANEIAQDLGLIGWVKNLPDGTLEIVAYGPEDDLQELYHWLEDGPDHAEVESVEQELQSKEEVQGLNDFAIR